MRNQRSLDMNIKLAPYSTFEFDIRIRQSLVIRFCAEYVCFICCYIIFIYESIFKFSFRCFQLNVGASDLFNNIESS